MKFVGKIGVLYGTWCFLLYLYIPALKTLLIKWEATCVSNIRRNTIWHYIETPKRSTILFRGCLPETGNTNNRTGLAAHLHKSEEKPIMGTLLNGPCYLGFSVHIIIMKPLWPAGRVAFLKAQGALQNKSSRADWIALLVLGRGQNV